MYQVCGPLISDWVIIFFVLEVTCAFSPHFYTNKIKYNGSLDNFRKTDLQGFIEYNIKDVELILKLEDKLKLIELALTLAYDTKSNFNDVFAQTRMWDAIIYNYLFERKIIVPPKTIQKKDSAFEGAYVKEPQIGVHDYVASFDLNSLYPLLMVQYNISPETVIDVPDYDDDISVPSKCPLLNTDIYI